MAVCPRGHESDSDDFCDLCGLRMDVGAPAASPVSPAGPWRAREPCPRCGSAGSGRFCGRCGFEFTAANSGPGATVSAYSGHADSGAPYSTRSVPAARPPAPYAPAPYAPAPYAPAPYAAAPAAWTAVVSADRVYYDCVRAAGGQAGAAVAFPRYYAERRVPLAGDQMRIGRRSMSRGLAPEIDVTGPPADPGVSRLHAVLIAAPDGGWAVLDPGSVNGTVINGAAIPVGDQVPLRDGDRINVGVWTAITVHRD